MTVERLTVAQALIRYLANQYVERDGVRARFFAGCWGIFGHGNVAGIGQALHQYRDRLRFIPSRNEQAQVHAAAAFARQKNRLQTWACTSSVGPGATNMITGAAAATINRLPVLLLPGDVFASRRPNPVLQQLESSWSQDLSVNDAFKPVSRYWDRISRAEQLLAALPEAMRVLTDPAETGAVTIALPEDVQVEAFDYPAEFLRERTWYVERPAPDARAMSAALELIRSARCPLIIAGGGVIYSDASDALAMLASQAGIPVAETMAGKGSLHFSHPMLLGAVGATGTAAANVVAREADLVIGVGTRWSDFTTASRTAFQNERVRFVNINVARFEALKLSGLSVVADARVALEQLATALSTHRTDDAYRRRVASLRSEWDAARDRICASSTDRLPTQAEVIGVVNDAASDGGIVVCAAGSLPGDLHKLWRCSHTKSHHVEYGYSCMGYEVAGGLGVKLASPERDVYVMVGDGSWLMMSSELVTTLQEHAKIVVVLLDNHGYASIGGLSESIGSEGFGTSLRERTADGELAGSTLAIDFAANAASLGAHVVRAATAADLRSALEESRSVDHSVVIVVETDRASRVGSFESWWDVPVAEVSTEPAVRAARRDYERRASRRRWFV